MSSSERFDIVRICLFIVAFYFPACVFGQDVTIDNERNDPAYSRLKEDALAFLDNVRGNPLSPMIVSDNVLAYRRGKFAVLATVLDDSASDGIDTAVVSFAHRKKIPLTLFLSGMWINSNATFIKQLSSDSTFEIENAGLQRAGLANTHRTSGLSPADCVDEIELNARKIYEAFHKKVLFYLPPENARGNETALIACYLNEYILSPDIIVPEYYSLEYFEKEINKFHDRGVVVLIRARRKNPEVVSSVVSALQASGFSIVKLERLVN